MKNSMLPFCSIIENRNCFGKNSVSELHLILSSRTNKKDYFLTADADSRL